MKVSPKYATLIFTREEYDALPDECEVERGYNGYFRGQSTAIGHTPMAGKWVDDPLDGWKRVWWKVEFEEMAGQAK